MAQQGDNGNNELLMSSHMMMILSYTIFSVILIGETIIMGWERWAVFLIMAGVISSWYMHLKQIAQDGLRMWIISLLMMMTFFFYGSHTTSTYDLAIVISVVMLLYTMTGLHSLVTLCQITYYLTMTYEIVSLYREGTEFDSLLVTRTFLHFAMVTMVGWIARTIINRWNDVLGRSREEIKTLTETTNRLNDFLANVSHEIRTPINAILGMCDMSIEAEDEPAKRERLVSIEEAGKRIGEQISDILDYSEIDKSDLTNNCEDYMLSSVLNDIVNELGPMLTKKIELIIDVEASIPSMMNTDVGKLKKILRHLISNGLKYTNEGGVYVHISSIPHDYGINLCIEIRDTGIGMDEVQLEKIYENYYKADSGRARKTGGLGLGIPIVHGFVRSLGGFMTVESAPGEGTTVRVSIPNKVVDESECMSVTDRENISLGAYLHFEKYPNPNVREYYNTMVRNIVTGLKVSMHRVDNVESLHALTDSKRLTHLFAGPEEYNGAVEFMEDLAKKIIVTVIADPKELLLPPDSRVRVMPKPFYCFPVVGILNSKLGDEIVDEGKVSFPGARVLVVDDEPMNLIVSTGMFKTYGCVVTTCESGQEAIDLCRDNDYDIIFMDHMMPVMDGIEAMKRIRADQSRGKIMTPIVAFTANAVSTAREMFKREGFEGFVSKPVDRIELERVMKHVLPANLIRIEETVKETISETVSETVTAQTVTSEEQSDEGDPMERLKKIGIDTDKGLHYSGGDREFYISLLEQYVKESGKKKAIMKEALAADNLDDYAIQVHSIKSTSKMIGAMDLSESARELETAAKNGDRAYVDDNHQNMLLAYERILDLIRPQEDADHSDNDTDTAGEADDAVIEFVPEGGNE
ncbi:MAG: response regulator [Lachnospiraceae bacterium]|nr:response regulator [Lachnospiraceae bacterium]